MAGCASGEFCEGVRRTLRGHRIDPPIEQLMTAFLTFCPGKEFVQSQAMANEGAGPHQTS